MSHFFSGKPTDKISYEWDHAVKGLAVRTSKSGSTAYVTKYAFQKKQVWKTIGSTELISLSDARGLVYRMKLLAKNGEDPSFVLIEFLSEKPAKSITFGKFAQLYIERHAREHKKSWKLDQGRINQYLKAWENRSIADITREDVLNLHKMVGKKTKVRANRPKEQIHTMFKLAALWGYLPENHPNPASGVTSYREYARDRFVEHSEMPELLKSIAGFPCIYLRTAVMVALYTGMRHSEILKLKWSEVDLEQRIIKIQGTRTKTSRPIRQPLVSHAVVLLNELPRYESNPYVFPSNRGGHISKSVLDRAWQKIRREAGLEDVRFHDLRHTVGSWLIQQTGDIRLVGKVLNQTNQHVTAVYTHHHHGQVEAAMNNYADLIRLYYSAEGCESSDSASQ